MLKKLVSMLAIASILSFGVIGCEGGLNKEAIGKSKLQAEAAVSRQEALKEKSSSRPPGPDAYN